PRHEPVEVARPAWLAHAMHGHTADLVHARLTDRQLFADAPGEHIHDHPLTVQRLGELAHVPSETALDHGRVLPGEEQHAIAHARDPISPSARTAEPHVPHLDLEGPGWIPPERSDADQLELVQPSRGAGRPHPLLDVAHDTVLAELLHGHVQRERFGTELSRELGAGPLRLAVVAQ